MKEEKQELNISTPTSQKKEPRATRIDAFLLLNRMCQLYQHLFTNEPQNNKLKELEEKITSLLHFLTAQIYKDFYKITTSNDYLMELRHLSSPYSPMTDTSFFTPAVLKKNIELAFFSALYNKNKRTLSIQKDKDIAFNANLENLELQPPQWILTEAGLYDFFEAGKLAKPIPLSSDKFNKLHNYASKIQNLKNLTIEEGSQIASISGYNPSNPLSIFFDFFLNKITKDDKETANSYKQNPIYKGFNKLNFNLCLLNTEVPEKESKNHQTLNIDILDEKKEKEGNEEQDLLKTTQPDTENVFILKNKINKDSVQFIFNHQQYTITQAEIEASIESYVKDLQIDEINNPNDYFYVNDFKKSNEQKEQDLFFNKINRTPSFNMVHDGENWYYSRGVQETIKIQGDFDLGENTQFIDPKTEKEKIKLDYKKFKTFLTQQTISALFNQDELTKNDIQWLQFFLPTMMREKILTEAANLSIHRLESFQTSLNTPLTEEQDKNYQQIKTELIETSNKFERNNNNNNIHSAFAEATQKMNLCLDERNVSSEEQQFLFDFLKTYQGALDPALVKVIYELKDFTSLYSFTTESFKCLYENNYNQYFYDFAQRNQTHLENLLNFICHTIKASDSIKYITAQIKQQPQQRRSWFGITTTTNESQKSKEDKERFVKIMSERIDTYVGMLTKLVLPLKELIKEIEKWNLENLNHKIPYDHIQSLIIKFDKTNKHLNCVRSIIDFTKEMSLFFSSETKLDLEPFQTLNQINSYFSTIYNEKLRLDEDSNTAEKIAVKLNSLFSETKIDFHAEDNKDARLLLKRMQLYYCCKILNIGEKNENIEEKLLEIQKKAGVQTIYVIINKQLYAISKDTQKLLHDHFELIDPLPALNELTPTTLSHYKAIEQAQREYKPKPVQPLPKTPNTKNKPSSQNTSITTYAQLIWGIENLKTNALDDFLFSEEDISPILNQKDEQHKTPLIHVLESSKIIINKANFTCRMIQKGARYEANNKTIKENLKNFQVELELFKTYVACLSEEHQQLKGILTPFHQGLNTYFNLMQDDFSMTTLKPAFQKMMEEFSNANKNKLKNMPEVVIGHNITYSYSKFQAFINIVCAFFSLSITFWFGLGTKDSRGGRIGLFVTQNNEAILQKDNIEKIREVVENLQM